MFRIFPQGFAIPARQEKAANLDGGNDAPLAEVLESVADGYPLLKIADVFEITLQQLIAVLQFAAEGAAAAGPAK